MHLSTVSLSFVDENPVAGTFTICRIIAYYEVSVETE